MSCKVVNIEALFNLGYQNTLRTLIEKYTKDKCDKLFACFIDFRKAFDTVIHDIMLYKLLKIGIAGNFYNI